MLLDANLLLYGVNQRAPQHEKTAAWLAAQLNGSRRVGFPWQSINAFLRISTHPRAFERPLAPVAAWELVTDWLAAPVAWVPEPGPRYPAILGDLLRAYEVRGNVVPDASLAALAIEHGVALKGLSRRRSDSTSRSSRGMSGQGPFRPRRVPSSCTPSS